MHRAPSEQFINYDKFKLIYNQQFEGEPAESSFLKLKFDISSNFGPIDRNEKYPPPMPNKNVPTWISRPHLNCLKKQKGGKKTIGTSLDKIK